MGRPSKGARRCLSVRAPLNQAEVYERRADELGIDLGDYWVLVMARASNLDIPDYILKKLDPERLRIHDSRYALHRTQTARDAADGELSVPA
ncbi:MULTISPECIES: hypothetical protein [Rhodococcus]|uniref:Uncharacterized protein n=1 Tax=Rhodococcus erythropolis (strain PR4 / NBRC 100887) TaxID=234621 RepID=Q3LA11_RHOE4|nr:MULTISPECIES: hypothetical protein [Rhodococcus]MBF7737335.1 hypothetical protein [Rhodococcus erythropolis]MBY6388728.1 hypothetical protein [Rhodococcus erythropolis]MCZ4570055.1 hypothetical protein [Rhodococcus erythropolis]MCZ4618052.1 hypothetical protein [Rhodococcus qingshengii]MCZ4644890.1 hypothetical protein [Rhodococcus erythropolis]